MVPSSQEPILYALLHLAADGLDGHPSIAHGGVISTVLDEIMGLGIQHVDRQLYMDQGARGASTTDQGVFTARLQIAFVSPTAVPDDVVVRVWCDGHEGRKYASRAEVVAWDREGQREVVRAEGRAVWVKVKSAL